jgi:arylformamidase
MQQRARRATILTLYDITPMLEPGMPVWPGDSTLSREVLLQRERGDSVTLSTMRATVHLGAHADAPNHYGNGPSIEARDLSFYVGPCEVVRVHVPRSTRVSVRDLPDIVAWPERVLIATASVPDRRTFNRDFAALTPELVDWLHDRGVRLVGVDTPSVDLFDDAELLAHQRFLANDMAILEGLVLADVPPGRYELMALPLKLRGFDGSPVRAVLRRS